MVTTCHLKEELSTKIRNPLDIDESHPQKYVDTLFKRYMTQQKRKKKLKERVDGEDDTLTHSTQSEVQTEFRVRYCLPTGLKEAFQKYEVCL